MQTRISRHTCKQFFLLLFFILTELVYYTVSEQMNYHDEAASKIYELGVMEIGYWG
jgi:hypothetical protein